MKILVLTSVYPQIDDDKSDGVTPVVHYFAKEWVKSGNKVLVIHNANKFIFPLYLLPRFLKKKINSFMGMALPKFSQRKVTFRVSEGVKIKRIPILKIVPRRDFFPLQIKNHFNKITQTLRELDFSPDVIIGHWEAPQIQLVSLLKEVYKCKSCLVFHGAGYISSSSYVQKNRKHLNNIDVYGARSEKIADRVKQILNLPYEPFVCHSGVPDTFIEASRAYQVGKSFTEGALTEFLYVGRLIRRKNINAIIKALSQVYGSKKFKLNIVGTGECKNELISLTEKLSLKAQVKFTGLLSREEVLGHMRRAECFTMISTNEVFGLVYLEAMAQGCIVIASKGGGFDGIIIDGENGFLCQPGNVEELADIYMRINVLSQQDKDSISQKAMKTASLFSDSNVAKRYLDNIMSFVNTR